MWRIPVPLPLRHVRKAAASLVAVPILLTLPAALGATSASAQVEEASAPPGAAGVRPPSPASIFSIFPDDTLETIASEAMEAVVLLDVETETGERQGSGFIVDPDGRIFTNYHVVRGARSIEVRLASGDVYDRVEILGIDERRDIAVLKVPGFELPTVPLGNSTSVRIGTPVIVIGSPLGLENTVSTGIVSGRRSEPEGFQLLQITAPTSQGSSGGPVISRSGEVVGIAVSQLREGQNLNFAVPINYARGLIDHLGSEPVAVLSPDAHPSLGVRANVATDPSRVNGQLTFDLDDFYGFSVETQGRVGENRQRRSRVTYRRIEAVGGLPSIERYAEAETTDRTGPFDTPQTVRRERSRAIVAADDLRPISVRGETAWWDGNDWHHREYRFQFDGYHVTGTISDTAGRVRELSRDLPPGIILRGVRHLAFATLAEDSLVGRSVEFVTFDAAAGEVTSDRYDVRASTEVEVAGESHPALRVNLASGLANTLAYFRRAVPRVLLRRGTGYQDETEEVSDLRLFGPETDGSGRSAGPRSDGDEDTD